MASEAYAAIYASLPFHKKVRTIPAADRLAALGYYTAVCVYCQTYRTDGCVAHEQLVAVLPCTEEERTRYTAILVRVGLFDEVEDGIEVHDYLSVNKSREQIENARDRMSEGGKHSPKRPQKVASEGTLPRSTEKRTSTSSGEESTSRGVKSTRPHDPECPDCEGTGTRTRDGQPCEWGAR